MRDTVKAAPYPSCSLAVLVIVVLVVVLALKPNDPSAWAQVIAALGLLTMTLLLFSTGPKRLVARADFTLNSTNYKVGQEIAAADQDKARQEHSGSVSEQRGLYFHLLYVGHDGRWSTSKVQILLWTYAVLFGLLALWVAKVLGDPAGYDHQVDLGLQDEYLLLLGGPFAAGVMAKLSTSTKVEDGTIPKTTDSTPTAVTDGISQVVSDDSGDTDLVDTQYFLFNLLALAVFLGTFIFHLNQGFPDIPGLLVGLTSASALAYVGKKAAERAVPSLLSIDRSRVAPGDEVHAVGLNLLVDPPSSPPPEGWGPTAKIGGLPAAVSESRQTQEGQARLTITVPPGIEVGEEPQQLIVSTAAGVSASAVDLTIESGVHVDGVAPTTIKVDTSPIIIAGTGFGEQQDDLAAVEIDHVHLPISIWTNERLEAGGSTDLQANPQAKLIVRNSAGRESPAYPVVVAS